MSYMSELSIAAATTHHEGPSSLDLLAHEVAHAAVAYLGTGYTEDGYRVFKELTYKFEKIHKVITMCEEHRCTPRMLKDVLSGLIAAEYCQPGAEVSFDKLNELREQYRIVIETAAYF